MNHENALSPEDYLEPECPLCMDPLRNDMIRGAEMRQQLGISVRFRIIGQRAPYQIEADAIARMTELNDIAAQAKRLGVDIDPAEAMRNGVTPDSFRKQVLEQAATLDRATDIVAAVAAPDSPKNDDRLLNAVKTWKTN